MKNTLIFVFLFPAFCLAFLACGGKQDSSATSRESMSLTPSGVDPTQRVFLTKSVEEVDPLLLINTSTLPSEVELKAQLVQLMNAWGWRAQDWDVERKKALNQQFFYFTKNQRSDISAPSDFLISQKGKEIAHPISIGGEEVELQEGRFYRITGIQDLVDLGGGRSEYRNFRIAPIEFEQYAAMNGHLLSAGTLSLNDRFGYVIYRQGDHIYLRFDGKRWEPSQQEYDLKRFYVNGYEFPPDEGGTFQMRANDLAFSSELFTQHIRFQFKVLEHGRVLLPRDIRFYPPQTAAARIQSVQFRNPGADRSGYKFSTYPNRMEIQEDVRLLNGFSAYALVSYFADPYIPSRETWTQGAWHEEYGDFDLIYFDLERDPILNKVINYFREESAALHYTPLEKAMRLAHMLNSMTRYSDYRGSGFRKRNFLIGEMLNAGHGVCRHTAFIFKGIADQVGLNCSLVTSTVVGDRHVWNYCQINGNYYLVDATQQRFAPLLNGLRGELGYSNFINYYGIPNGIFN